MGLTSSAVPSLRIAEAKPLDLDLVSVIIPVYNGDATIAQALESVLVQTHRRLEILVIDDGSEDATSEVVRSYTDPRIRLLRFGNRGVAASRNRGLEAAGGSMLSLLDCDDWWSPEKIECQVAALRSHPEAGVAYSFTRFVDEAGRPLHEGLAEPVAGEVLERLFVRFFLQSGSNALWRREVIERIGRFDEALDPVDDYDFFLRAAAHFSFVPVPEHQIFYRIREGSLSTRTALVRRQGRRVVEQAAARHPERLAPLRTQALAMIDAWALGRALRSDLGWRNLLLCAACLWAHVRIGPAGLRALFQRRHHAAHWLPRLFRSDPRTTSSGS